MIEKRLWWHISDNIKVDKSSITLNEYYEWNLDQSWMEKINQCKSCDLYSTCRGIPKDYLEVYKNIKLSPIKWIKQ
jgi:radical SAM protein with 4Fe4S-binding SPASM domain